jgi:hypothetical protein
MDAAVFAALSRAREAEFFAGANSYGVLPIAALGIPLRGEASCSGSLEVRTKAGRGKEERKRASKGCPLNPNNQTCGCSLNAGAQRSSQTGLTPIHLTKPNNHTGKDGGLAIIVQFLVKLFSRRWKKREFLARALQTA